MVLDNADSVGDKFCSYNWIEEMLERPTDDLVKDALEITCEGDFVKAYREMLNVLNITALQSLVCLFHSAIHQFRCRNSI